jgi:hypothetical protein
VRPRRPRRGGGPMAVRDRLYGDAPELADALSELGPAVLDVDRTDDGVLDEAATAQAPVVRFVNALLARSLAPVRRESCHRARMHVHLNHSTGILQARALL